jgi:catechol 2,3-dioxygenase-like lactoylglutathione lyase family enzyme
MKAGLNLINFAREPKAAPNERVTVPRGQGVPNRRARRDETLGGEGSVRELRVALTAEDFEGAVALYGGALGLHVVKEWDEPRGRGAIFAGAATIEVIDRPQAEYIDEVEAGERVSGPVRLALGVADVEQVARSLRQHGAAAVGDPVTTPWGDFNQRLRAPDGMQLTLFGRDGG